MRIIDRFDEYMTFKHLNDNRATKDLGFSIGMIGKSRSEGRDLSKKAVQRILAVYNDIDETWLISLDKLIDQMFTNGKTMSKLADQIGVAHQLIANSQQHLTKAQEETDRIISLLELEKGSKAELEKALKKRLEECDQIK